MATKGAKEDNLVIMPQRFGDELVSRVARALEGIEKPVEVFSDDPAKAAARAPRQDAAQAATDASDPAGERESLQSISLEQIQPSPFQTRELEDDEALMGLAQSIRNKGVIQPIIVRKLSDPATGRTRYQLVAGERRLRAARLAGLSSLPARVEELSDRESLELLIIENAQRENLNPIEEALSFKRLSDDFGLSQTEISRLVGKNRASISNAMRLLQLDDEVIEYLKKGELSAGHGRALLMLETAAEQRRFARRAAQSGMSVRALENLVQRRLDVEGESELSEEDLEKAAALERLKNKISTFLDLENVDLRLDSQGRRRLSLVFETEAAWKRFMARIRS